VVDVVFLRQGFERVEQLARDDGGARCNAFEDAGGGFGRNTAVLVVVENAEDLCVAPLAQRLAVVYEDDAFELRGQCLGILRYLVSGEKVFVSHRHLRVVERKFVLWSKVQSVGRGLQKRNGFDGVRVIGSCMIQMVRPSNRSSHGVQVSSLITHNDRPF
jgi:hypothetical protein